MYVYAKRKVNYWRSRIRNVVPERVEEIDPIAELANIFYSLRYDKGLTAREIEKKMRVSPEFLDFVIIKHSWTV